MNMNFPNPFASLAKEMEDTILLFLFIILVFFIIFYFAIKS